MHAGAAARWFIPKPEIVSTQRAQLYFGLRRAEAFYRELVVPGIGGVWFVRQLSWAAAALALAPEQKERPSTIANALEALACKYAWQATSRPDSAEADGRLRGVRAFQRHPEAWSFKELSQRKYYVQNTFRQSTTSALPEGRGLGLTTGGRLMNAMVLTAQGEALAQSFLGQTGLQGGACLRDVLVRWVMGEKRLTPGMNGIGRALSPRRAGPDERGLIVNRLRALAPAQGLVQASADRRARLVDIFEGAGREVLIMAEVLEDLRRGDAGTQAAQIVAAAAFDELLETARQVIHEAAQALEAGHGPRSAGSVSGAIAPALDRWRDAARDYLKRCTATGAWQADAASFAKLADAAPSDAALLAQIAQRDGHIVALSAGDGEGGRLVPGPLFRSRKAIEESAQRSEGEPEAHGELKPRRLRQLHALWRDCHAD